MLPPQGTQPPIFKGNSLIDATHRGVILPFVLVVLCVLGVLVFSFSNWASHSQRMVFRSEQDQVAKRLLEGAVDEAFFLFNQETASSKTSSSQWLSNNSDAASQEWNLTKLPQTKILAAEFDQNGPSRISSLSVLIFKRAEDFRNNRVEKGVIVPYYEREGHGTLVFRGTIGITKGGKQVTSFSLERHHDYKVVCLVSDRKNGARSKAPNRCFDYVLFVRKGMEEFKETNGRMLNNSNLNLEIKPNAQGKIYFGGTDRKEDFVFVNLGPDQNALIPQDTSSRPIDQTQAGPMGEDALNSDSETKAKIEQEIQGIPGTTATSAVKDKLERSTLNGENVPFSPNPVDLEKDARDALFGDPNQTGDRKDNTEPGIKLLGGQDQPHLTIEGNVRQRYLHLVEFNNSEVARIQGKRKILALTPQAYEQFCRKTGQKIVQFILTIFRWLDRLTPGALRKPTTDFDDELLYGGKLESERNTTYAPRSLNIDYQPFSCFNLRSNSAANAAELADLGILTSAGLQLRGANHVRSPLVLGDQGPLAVEGEGILSTNSDITIKHGISCKNGAVCILWTKGNLIIDTTDQIEAGIIANEVIVNSGKALKLKGALFVNKLGSAKWPNGPHVIEYDRTNFFKESADLYTVSISPKISFLRMTSVEP